MTKKLQEKSIKWWVRTGSFLTLFVFIVVFSYDKMSFLVKGVKIEANISHDNNSSIVSIKGNAEKAIHLTLNGREIFIEKDGTFREPIALLPGFSVVTLLAEDKFGKTDEKKFEVMYEESTGAVAIGNAIINTN
jgi:hypothetical protein